ncbi:MAG TPA: ZIP family metal transporter [Casimicrobiaceae bacterium]|nr:ZIP family metal transporter [Casimicrobiaceae bacterium]
MNPLLATILACLAGGVLSIVAAAGTLALHPSRIARLVSFAVGALLGAVFLELLPHALEDGTVDGVMMTVLAGLLAFFLLEKLVLWRHSHGDRGSDAESPTHAGHHHHGPVADSGRSGLMILIGNSVHNFCDGIVIAASFLANPALGVATTLAIVAHAIPQQVGDFAILLMSGFGRAKAFAYNVTTGAATVVGGIAGYLFLAPMQQILPNVLALAGASLLYVAVADLIPTLHRHIQPLETAKQLLLIGCGIGIIAAVHVLLEGG